MKPPFPSMTPTWHNEPYSAIDPTDPRLSLKGKTAVITGAGSGIGREIALAFAAAGAKHLALLGRTKSKLEDTATMIQAASATRASVHAVSVTDERGLQTVAAEIGIWDILVLNAGVSAALEPVKDSKSEEWWETYETNVRGSYLTVKSFLSTATPDKPKLLNVSSAVVVWPASYQLGWSAYTPSKIAQLMFVELVHAEHPDWFVASFQPGIIVTPMTQKSGVAVAPVPKDDIKLPAHFAVWLASAEAAFLNGKFAWANWDVDELRAQAGEIKASRMLTASNSGYPYPHGKEEVQSSYGSDESK